MIQTIMNKEDVLASLEEKGYESYLVGGFVRDKLMGRVSSDIDIATKARPDEIKEVFRDKKTIEVGKAFGTIKLIADHKEYEITTFRSDGIYKDKRRPVGVSFSDSIYEDLKRRDFTINAIAIRNNEIIDPFDGRNDLEKKLIRAVGNPNERIEEDYLRALRAVRFASTLGFEIDGGLKNAIRENSSNISYISVERQRAELDKIILSDNPARGIRLLEDLDLLDEILPEVANMVGFDQKSPHHNLDLFEHSLKVLENVPKDLPTRLAALFHDTGKPDTFFLDENGHGRFFGHQKISEDLAKNRLKVLKYPNKTIEEVCFLIGRHMDSSNTYSEKSVARLLRKLGDEGLRRLFDLQEADILATVHDDISNIENGRRFLDEIISKEPALSRADLAINGKDLIKIGFEEGKVLGYVLDELFKAVFEGDLPNKKDKLLDFASKIGQKLDRKTYE